jgi:hypothetical protein
MMIFFNFIIDYDTYIAEQMDKGIQAMKESGMTEEQIRNRMASVPAFFSSQLFSLIMIGVVGLLFDTILSLIVAAFVKKDQPHS